MTTKFSPKDSATRLSYSLDSELDLNFCRADSFYASAVNELAIQLGTDNLTKVAIHDVDDWAHFQIMLEHSVLPNNLVRDETMCHLDEQLIDILGQLLLAYASYDNAIVVEMIKRLSSL